jgi:chemotaxis-related protein WspD
MNNRPSVEPSASSAIVKDCWTTIGVHGDASCPELRRHVHCRNCPVFSAGAMRLLDREAPADDLARWTSHFAQPKAVDELQTHSIVVFRIGREWLALPTPCVTEVVNRLPIHTLPHRPKGTILGLASVRGELVVCVSIGHMIGLESAPEPTLKDQHGSHQRLLVIRRDQVRAVCPVDDVHGIHRFHLRELTEVPSTVAKRTATYSRALLPWRERSVGLLDDERLFHTLQRSMA